MRFKEIPIGLEAIRRADPILAEQLLSLSPGTILDLGTEGDQISLRANGVDLAVGEIFIHEGRFAVKLTGIKHD